MGVMLILEGLNLTGRFLGFAILGAAGAAVGLAALAAVSAAAGTLAARLLRIDAGLKARAALGAGGLLAGWLALGLAFSAAGIGAGPLGPRAAGGTAEAFVLIKGVTALLGGAVAVSWLIDLAVAALGAALLALIWRAARGRGKAD